VCDRGLAQCQGSLLFVIWGWHSQFKVSGVETSQRRIYSPAESTLLPIFWQTSVLRSAAIVRSERPRTSC
jgi:hypothetical protein